MLTEQSIAEYKEHHDSIWEQVKNGTVDPVALMNLQRSFIHNKLNLYLRSLSISYTVTIPACQGGKYVSLVQAHKTFQEIDLNGVERCHLDTAQTATKETRVSIYEMWNQNATFFTLFNSLNSNLKNLAFPSQEQIEVFVREQSDWLRKSGYGTFFLFTEEVDGKEEYFVAIVCMESKGYSLKIRPLSYGLEWNACGTHRIVVPEQNIVS